MEKRELKLVLIDSNAIIHRAYHSMPKTLSTRNGEPTNAVYGFTVALIKVLEDLKPEYLAAAFDLAGPTFRHEVYNEYKATRVAADQELYDQIPRVKQLLEAMGIPIYEKEGYEADDTIGTIISQISNLKTQNRILKVKTESPPESQQFDNTITYIVTGDKDLFQLINGNVKVYNLRKGLSDTQIVDSASIREQYGLDPHDFIDLKALAGDPSDNIPGVPGIGPKTATQLLQTYDTLEKLYQFIETEEQNNQETKGPMKPRIKNLLIQYKEQAFLSQHLATIHRDVPIEFDLQECKWGEYDRGELRKLFEELGFQSLLRRFSGRDSTEEQKNPSTPLGAGRGTKEPKNISTEKHMTEVQKKDEQLKLL